MLHESEKSAICFGSRDVLSITRPPRRSGYTYGLDPAVFSLHRLTLCWFQPTVMAAEASLVFINTRWRIPKKKKKNADDLFSCFTLFSLKCLADS